MHKHTHTHAAINTHYSTHTHTHTYTHIPQHVCVCVCAHTTTNLCTHTHTHICTHTHRHTLSELLPWRRKEKAPLVGKHRSVTLSPTHCLCPCTHRSLSPRSSITSSLRGDDSLSSPRSTGGIRDHERWLEASTHLRVPRQSFVVTRNRRARKHTHTHTH